MPIDDSKHAQIEKLTTLLILDDEIRKLMSLSEFGSFATNESSRLIPYSVGYLWEKKQGENVQLFAQSNTVEMDVQSPNNKWLSDRIQEILKSSSARQIHQIAFENDAAESLPRYLLWCPFLSDSQEVIGGLIFFRESSFSETEKTMLGWLLSSYQYVWKVLVKQKKVSFWLKFKRKQSLIGALILVLVIILFPVQLSVLTTGTVVPKSVVFINAPTQGVIKVLRVSPGTAVKAGQLLFTFDTADLRSEADMIQKELLLTQEKLQMIAKQKLDNDETRVETFILQAQIEMDQSRLDHTLELLKKADVISPVAGMVLFDNTEELIGKSVYTGERILSVADPTQMELEILLPISDMIPLDIGEKGEFLLYGQLVGSPIKLKSISFNAKETSNQNLTYQLMADFIGRDKTQLQIGAQGVVRLYGHKVPLIYYFLRRPFQAIRQSLGI